MAEYEYEYEETPFENDKEIIIKEGNNRYRCKIEKNKEYLDISIYYYNKIKYLGSIHIVSIQYQLGIYNINNKIIFEEIYNLNNNKFNLIKFNNKHKLQIEFKIINKKRYLNIDLFENPNDIDNDDYNIKKINELKEIIKEKDNKIKLLEEELNKYKNYNIGDKEPKHLLNYHNSWIRCSTVLKDGRFVTGSSDKSIIIYNNKTFQPDLIIKEHNNSVNCILDLSSGDLVSCSNDKTIKLYEINDGGYKVIQILNYHTDSVNKIIELKNKQLVSCSYDNNILFYYKKDNEYIKYYGFSTDGPNGPIIQTKDNEMCYYEDKNNSICFYDLIKKNIINKIYNISVAYYIYDSFLIISKELLLLSGYNKLSIVNINSYNLINITDISGSGWIYSACMLNKNEILTGDSNKRLIQWKIEDNNLKYFSMKENAHNQNINTIKKLRNGLILSGSDDNYIKIW